MRTGSVERAWRASAANEGSRLAAKQPRYDGAKQLPGRALAVIERGRQVSRRFASSRVVPDVLAPCRRAGRRTERFDAGTDDPDDDPKSSCEERQASDGPKESGRCRP